MKGELFIVGTGPGNPQQTTPEALVAIAASNAVFGYGPYLERLALREDQRRVASDNREELARARDALMTAARGEQVCVVSGGDPGVFAMASAICEAIETGPAAWRVVNLTIVPGVTAMLSVAARFGAPLGHDFCAISLSNNLKPWSIIEKRLRAVAIAGLAIALYNPISQTRPWQLGAAFSLLREVLPWSTPVLFGRAVGRPNETITTMPLSRADSARADMATCIIIGSPETRIIDRPGLAPLIYTPRSSEGSR